MALKIKDFRKMRGLTGEQLADMVGVSKGYISELETGKKTPGAGLVLRLADALHITPEQLMSGELSDDIATILPTMKQLTVTQRAMVHAYAEGLLASQQNSEHKQ